MASAVSARAACKYSRERACIARIGGILAAAGSGVKLGRPKGPGKSKLDPHKDEIIALLRNGVPKKLVARKYGTAIVNLYNWILKNNLDVTVRG